ncbi:uncharacterized protein LOC129905758 [Episyrphus balteatus]|uniref:uncharacterized protein LOC129905758 n=1 Tax=Episyrphus balteatus TaxID=286459 RepID=UPI002486455B|nr:uncharacterized protein LOC129905758 [Episyrphus balteatus]XP_055837294.1 uncharacterized protein LOC129905758 [Episyrphus balteatus]XP_055837295.1 uncharacterized protein LOC129905758 [Episyrphus balteatus]
MDISISFYDIVQYFDGVKRSIKEGEEIVKAGWVYAIGLSPPPSTNEVTAIVVAVSSMTSKPHEVKLKTLHKDHLSWTCTCSCKAGCGSKCKHIAACLIYIHKYPHLDIISSTEITQKWGKLGKQFATQFCSVDASDLCHCRRQIKVFEDVVNEDIQKEIFQGLLAGNLRCVFIMMKDPPLKLSVFFF